MNSDELFLQMIEERDLEHCVFLAFIRLSDQQREGDRKLLQELDQQKGTEKQ